ncbi:MAG: hypothetical protein NWQ54_02270 [Paraglaciecola sp.]|uniref:hypothetical protein n=1 Tax=Pseudomonadati TaxID=3379134 RepID=UPI00273DC899|nr:hypothetical protein [Paraglaciecola sp.]MDP5030602.1 hypothetical protein [Paraglaciecola sp.]MDP5129679.1 hypothetical protein [Paraglaciecola sp.]
MSVNKLTVEGNTCCTAKNISMLNINKLAQMLLGLFLSLFFFSALADNTGGVFGPVVNDGHRSFEYRIGIDPDNAAGEVGFAHRIHYQQAINGDFQWRILAQARKTARSDNDFDFIQGELTWELQGTDTYKTGLRFDLRYRDAGRADQFGVNWMHQFKLQDNWNARLVAMTSVQFGSNAADGVGLATRGSVWKKSNYGDIGVELYNSYGRTSDIQDFKDQNHAIGPFFQRAVGKEGWQVFAGVLFGITDKAADTDLRFRISKKL